MSSSHFVVTLSFPDGPPDPEQRDAQRAFLDSLVQDGTLLAAGVFADDRGGGMSLLRASSLDDATSRFSKSPLVEAGVVSWDVREWQVTKGAL